MAGSAPPKSGDRRTSVIYRPPGTAFPPPKLSASRQCCREFDRSISQFSRKGIPPAANAPPPASRGRGVGPRALRGRTRPPRRQPRSRSNVRAAPRGLFESRTAATRPRLRATSTQAPSSLTQAPSSLPRELVCQNACERSVMARFSRTVSHRDEATLSTSSTDSSRERHAWVHDAQRPGMRLGDSTGDATGSASGGSGCSSSSHRCRSFSQDGTSGFQPALTGSATATASTSSATTCSSTGNCGTSSGTAACTPCTSTTPETNKLSRAFPRTRQPAPLPGLVVRGAVPRGRR